MPPLPARLTDWLENRRAAQTQKAADALREQVEHAKNKVAAAIHHHLWDFTRSLASEQFLETLRRTRRERGPEGVVEVVRELREKFYRDVCSRANLEAMREGLGSRFEPSPEEKVRRENHRILVQSMLGQWRHVAAGGTSTDGASPDVGAVLRLLTSAPVENSTRSPVTATAVYRMLNASTLKRAEKVEWEEWVRDGSAFDQAFNRAAAAPGAWVHHAAMLGPTAQAVLAKAGLGTYFRNAASPNY